MKTVLVVDDEFAIQAVLAHALVAKGYRVFTAGNGFEALRVLDEERCDVVITDDMMPLMSGEALVRAMERSPQHAAIPVVRMADLPAPPGARVLRKPVDPFELLATVERVLAGSSRPPERTALTFELLAERPEAVALVAGWWFDAWGTLLSPGATLEALAEQLRKDVHQPGLPVRLVAVENDMVVGSAVLKLHEMRDLYPDRRYWLGNVFVEPASRGRGVASALASEIVRVAEDMGCPSLHLQTQHLKGGLYRRLGWLPIDQVRYRGYDALVMVKTLAA